MNYWSPDREIARETPHGLTCQRGSDSPEWVRSGEVYEADGEVKLDLNLESGVAPDDIKALTDGLTGDLSSLFSHPVQPFRRRVFCIGWPKTGTTSFTEALRILGLFSCPWAPWVIGYKHVRSEISEFRIDFSGVADYTAVSNLPICALYRELDIAFPGSLFILTTRPLETWTISETAEWTTSEIADRDSDIKQYVNMDAMSRWAYGTDAIDKEVHQERYLQHQEQVLGYFSGRPDFLAIDISQGNPWQKLCEFLQLPVPQVAFPHLNRRMT